MAVLIFSISSYLPNLQAETEAIVFSYPHYSFSLCPPVLPPMGSFFISYTFNTDIGFQSKTYSFGSYTIIDLSCTEWMYCKNLKKQSASLLKGMSTGKGKGKKTTLIFQKACISFSDLFSLFIIITLQYSGKKESSEGCQSEFIAQLDYRTCLLLALRSSE